MNLSWLFYCLLIFPLDKWALHNSISFREPKRQAVFQTACLFAVFCALFLQILAKQLNISTHQLSYVTHSGEGEGLLFYGNVILPFVDRFPKDLELYRIMTTKPQEVQGVMDKISEAKEKVAPGDKTGRETKARELR